jgi:hypothetical protein
MSEVLSQGPREARDHAVIGGEAFAGVGARIAARKRDNPDTTRVGDPPVKAREDISRGARTRQVSH